MTVRGGLAQVTIVLLTLWSLVAEDLAFWALESSVDASFRAIYVVGTRTPPHPPAPLRPNRGVVALGATARHTTLESTPGQTEMLTGIGLAVHRWSKRAQYGR